MKSEQFFNIINDIDDDLILKAKKDNFGDYGENVGPVESGRRTPLWRFALPVAAGACVLFAGVFMSQRFINLHSREPEASVAAPSASADTPSASIGNQSASINNPSASAAIKSISEIVAQNDNLVLNVNMPQSIPSEVPKIKAKALEWDDNTVKKLFADKNGLTKYTEEDTTGGTFFDEKSNMYRGGNHNWLMYGAGSLSLELKEKMGPQYYHLIPNADTNTCMEKYFTEDSIGLFTKEDAVSRTDAIMSELGLTNCGKPNVYAITADKANALIRSYGPFPTSKEEDASLVYPEQWTADNEVYVVEYSFEFGGTQLAMYPALGGGSSSNGHGNFFIGSSIGFLVTKDDIWEINAHNILSPEYEVKDSVAIKCTAEEALYEAVKYYNSTADCYTELYDCRLVYVPFEVNIENEFTLIPMWEIQVAQNLFENNPAMWHESFYVNAQTGEVPLW